MVRVDETKRNTSNRMFTFIEKLAGSTISVIAGNLIWAAVVLIFVGTISYWGKIPFAYLIFIGVIVLILIAVASRETLLRRSYRYAWYPKVGHHFLILNKTIGYNVLDDGKLHFFRRMKIRALSDNVTSVLDKYVWTGGSNQLPSPGFGVSRVEEDLNASIWRYYRTILPRTLRKGETHEFQVDWYLDGWRNSQPFFSTSTEEPTKELTFDFLVPKDAISQQGVYFETMRGIESFYPFQAESMKVVHGGLVHTFKPKLYRHYRLRWAWAGDPLQPMPENK